MKWASDDIELNFNIIIKCYTFERKKSLIVKNAKETIRYNQLWVLWVLFFYLASKAKSFIYCYVKMR